MLNSTEKKAESKFALVTHMNGYWVYLWQQNDSLSTL